MNEMSTWSHPQKLHRPGLVAKLNKTMFGTKDASNAWKKLWSEHLRSSGFEVVASNPALYRSELVNGFCHGDDFVTAAAEHQNEGFGKLLQEKFDTRRIGMIGAAEHLDEELEVLHTSVRVINNELMEIEPDQQHVPQLLEDLGVTQSNIVKTPRVKLSVIVAEAIENRESKRQNYGAEPCDVRNWRRTVWTSLKQSSVLHERCRNRKQVT